MQILCHEKHLTHRFISTEKGWRKVFKIVISQPVRIPRTTPCCSGSAFLLTIALMAGYMILADAASIPASHINLHGEDLKKKYVQIFSLVLYNKTLIMDTLN